jgi:hypothetical protein
VQNMRLKLLQSAYKELLINFGINDSRAEIACQELTLNDLEIISDIWPEWNDIYSSM